MTAAWAGRLGLAALVAGCASAGDAPAPATAAQEVACAAAVAGHVRRPVDEVTAAFRAATPAGGAVIEARDGDRLHTCDVDAAGRVLRIDHPAVEAG